MKIGLLLGVDFVEPKIDKRVFLVAAALKDAGHEVQVFCWSRRFEDNADNGEYHGVPFTRIRQRLPKINLPFVTKIPSYFSLVQKMMKNLNTFKPDVVISTDLDMLPIAFLGKFFFKYNLVYDVHEHWPLMESNQSHALGVFTNYLESMLLLRVDGVITITETLASKYREEKKQTLVLHTAPFLKDIKKLEFAPRDEMRSRFGIKATDVLVGYIGSLLPDKGIEMIVESFSEIYKKRPDTSVKLMIVGGPPNLLEGLKDISSNLGCDPIIIFQEFVKHEEIHNYFNILDLAIIQYSDVPWANLAMAHKITEGFAFGVPAMVRNFKERSKFIRKHKSGFVFSNPAPKKVASAILSLVDSGLLPKLGRKAKKEFESKLCWEKQVDGLLAMINNFEH